MPSPEGQDEAGVQRAFVGLHLTLRAPPFMNPEGVDGCPIIKLGILPWMQGPPN